MRRGGEADDAAERPRVAELQRAIAARRTVLLEYDGARGASSVVIVPLVVGSRGVRWYLLAAPVEGGLADVDRVRTYRVDRIRSLVVRDDIGAPPEGFDAATAWARMVESVEGLRGEARAVIRVEPWAVRAVCDRFGAQARMLEDDGGLIEVRAHRIDALAEQLAGWTSVAEVVEPKEVRNALRELGERIVDRYRDG
ncbi:HTH domain protein [Microbacterium sp. HM58-2]|nr:HTH domain protein [Microbacterium sp. HM58-2]